MLNTQTLLELAALEYGLDMYFVPPDSVNPAFWWGMRTVDSDGEDDHIRWNPWISDTDAMQLALKLKINISWIPKETFNVPSGILVKASIEDKGIDIRKSPEEYKQAIVHAAAALYITKHIAGKHPFRDEISHV